MVSKYKAEIFLLKTEGKKNHYPMNIDSSSLHCCCERKRRERETLKRSKRGFFILGFWFWVEEEMKWNSSNVECVSEKWEMCEWECAFSVFIMWENLSKQVRTKRQNRKRERENVTSTLNWITHETNFCYFNYNS